MRWLQTTFAAYGRAAKAALTAFVRGPAALVGLVVAQLLVFAVSVLVGKANLGIVGGFIIGIISIGAAGSYLSLVEQALDGRRGVPWTAIQESVGTYFNDVMNVAFIFFIVDMLVGRLLPGPALLLLWLAIFILFNPVPELIINQRSFGGIETLRSAFRWVKKNGIEWFLPHFLIGGALVVVAPASTFFLLTAFGPRFGFVEGLAVIGPLLTALQRGWDLRTLLLAVLIPASIHLGMLFRCALFRELDSGGRRARAWQARFK